MTTKSNEKKGGYMRINNEIKFIKYMEGTEDKNYKKYIKKLLKLNWRHYKLYLVGGILEGWKTIDIDIAIIGKKDKYLIPIVTFTYGSYISECGVLKSCAQAFMICINPSAFTRERALTFQELSVVITALIRL